MNGSVWLRRAVLNDRDSEVAAGLAGEERHSVVGGPVVQAGAGGAVSSREINAYGGVGIAKPVNSDDREGRVFAERISCRSEIDERTGQVLVTTNAGQTPTGNSIDRSELTAKDDFAVGLQCDRTHESRPCRAVIRITEDQATSKVERKIERAVGQKPGDAFAGYALHLSEGPTDDHLVVGLAGQRFDGRNPAATN